MTYQAIIAGARGLVYFRGNNDGAMTERGKKLGRNRKFWERVLRPVIEEIGSKSPLYPALVAPNATGGVKVRRVDGKVNELNGLHNLNEKVEFCVRE